MIDQLTDAECEITECVARRLNEVIEAVHALDGITKWLTQHVGRWAWKEHEATRDGGQAADPVEAPTVEDRLEAMQATWQIMSESYTDACAEAKRLRAERDAAQARVAELEADAALGALVRQVVETHKTVEIVRSSTGYHDVLLNGHIDVHGKRHAIHGGGRTLGDALRAALGEEASDAH
jgi:hypothetical protein